METRSSTAAPGDSAPRGPEPGIDDDVRAARAACRQGRLGDAVTMLDDAMVGAGSPGLQVRMLSTQAALRRELCDAAGAVAALERAGTLLGDDTSRLRAATLLPPIMGSRPEVKADRDRIERAVAALSREHLTIDAPLGLFPTPDFYSVYHGVDDRPLREGFARILRRSCPGLDFVAPHCRAPREKTGARIKLGFVSAFFRDHTIGRLNEELLTGIDTERFDSVVVFVGGITDAKAAGIASRANRVLEVPCDLVAAREAIAAERLDHLHFADIGMDEFTYLLAFARLAPRQSVSWGHPVTSGIDTVDDFLSSEYLDAAGAERFYTEHLVRLEDPVVCYRRPGRDVAGFSRAAFGLPDGVPLYVCPQNLFKLHPDFDEVLAGILERDRNGLLVLLAPRRREWAERLLARLGARVADVRRRVAFLAPMSRSAFLGLLGEATVVLDPLHFGGGNTSLEAFAMAAPVVTMPGAFLRGRITAACYRVMGIDDGVVRDAQGYVELALGLAGDADRRAALRARIEDARDALFDRREAIAAHERYFAS